MGAGGAGTSLVSRPAPSLRPPHCVLFYYPCPREVVKGVGTGGHVSWRGARIVLGLRAGLSPPPRSLLLRQGATRPRLPCTFRGGEGRHHRRGKLANLAPLTLSVSLSTLSLIGRRRRNKGSLDFIQNPSLLEKAASRGRLGRQGLTSGLSNSVCQGVRIVSKSLRVLDLPIRTNRLRSIFLTKTKANGVLP